LVIAQQRLDHYFAHPVSLLVSVGLHSYSVLPPFLQNSTKLFKELEFLRPRPTNSNHPLIRPNDHLLPHGEWKIRSKSQAVIDQQKPAHQHPLQHQTKNSRLFWERGDQHRWWVKAIQQFVDNPCRVSFRRELGDQALLATIHQQVQGFQDKLSQQQRSPFRLGHTTENIMLFQQTQYFPP